MSKFQKNNLVAQANQLIEARYTITKNEQLLLLAMISLIEPEDKDFWTFSVTVEQLKEILNLNKTTSLQEFERIITRLMGRVVKINTKNGWKLRQWVSHADLEGNIISLRFHDDLKPYLLELKKRGNFTQYRLGIAIQFRSAYTIRIYQILKEYFSKKIYTFEFSVDDFRSMMLEEKSKKYSLFKDFKKYVINVAQKELSTIMGHDTDGKTPLYKSDLSFNIQTRRTGRKISHLIFTIKQQRIKPTKVINTDEENKKMLEPIILEYHQFGITTEQVQPYLEKRGEEALRNTLNKINADHKSGKIKSNVAAYAFKLLEENAGQKTPQEQAEEKKQEKIKAQQEKEEKQKKIEALKKDLEIQFGDMARENFLLSLNAEEKADIQYKIIQELQEAGNNIFIPYILKDLGSRKVGSFLNKHIPNFKEDKKIYIQEKLKEKGLL